MGRDGPVDGHVDDECSVGRYLWTTIRAFGGSVVRWFGGSRGSFGGSPCSGVG